MNFMKQHILSNTMLIMIIQYIKGLLNLSEPAPATKCVSNVGLCPRLMWSIRYQNTSFSEQWFHPNVTGIYSPGDIFDTHMSIDRAFNISNIFYYNISWDMHTLKLQE